MRATDDSLPPARPRRKDESYSARRQRARQLIAEVAWLFQPKVTCAARPEASLSDTARRGLSLLEALDERSGKHPGNPPITLWALARDGDALRGVRVDRALVGKANWTFLEAPQYDAEISQLLGDRAAWQARAQAELRQVTQALDAVAALMAERLQEVERSAASAVLDGCTLALEQPTRARRLEPRAAAALSTPRALRQWPADRALFLAGRLGGLDATARLVAREPLLAQPFVAEATVDFCLRFAEGDAAGFLLSLADLARAVQSAARDFDHRASLLFDAIARSFHGARGAARDLLAGARDKLAEELALVPGARARPNRRERHFFDVVNTCCRWFLGVKSPLDAAALRRVTRHPPRAWGEALVDELLQALGAMRPDIDAWQHRLATLAVHASAADHSVGSELAAWVGHCLRFCLPGGKGEGGLALAAEIARVAMSHASPARQATLYHLAVSGDALLDATWQHGGEGSPQTHDRMRHLLGLGTPTRSPVFFLGLCAKSVALADLLHAGIFRTLVMLAQSRPERFERAVGWLERRPALWPLLTQNRYHSLDDIMSLADDALLQDAGRLCDALAQDAVRGSDASWRDAADIVYVLLSEVINYPLHLSFTAEHFTFVRLVADSARAVSGDGDDRRMRAAERRAPILRYASHWHARHYPRVDLLVGQLLRLCESYERKQQLQRFSSNDNECDLLVRLSAGDATVLIGLFGRAPLDWGEAEAALAGLRRIARSNPAANAARGPAGSGGDGPRREGDTLVAVLQAAARDAKSVNPILRFLRRVELCARLPSFRRLQHELRHFDVVGAEAAATASATCLPPELAKAGVAELMHYQRLAGEPMQVPKALLRILERKDQLTAELARLRAGDDARTEKRRAKLEQLLADALGLQQWMQKDFDKALDKQLVHLRLAAAQRLIERAISAHWKEVLGVVPAEAGSPNWENALHILLGIRSNKRILKQLLRAVADGEPRRLLRHPANVAFAAKLRARGVEPQAWIGPHERTLALAKKRYRVYAVDDPLEVLQMGNLFSTCLSVGGVNAFSTVSNAVEMNKRVLMIRDDAGRVVGRKLLLLRTTGVLYGFHSYGGMLAWTEQLNVDPWVKILFDLCCVDICARTGARLSTAEEQSEAGGAAAHDELFTKWYNDGCEAFDFWIDALADVAARDTRIADDRVVDDRLAKEGVAARIERAFVDQEVTLANRLFYGAALRGLVWLENAAQPLLDKCAREGWLSAQALQFVREQQRTSVVEREMDRRDLRAESARSPGAQATVSKKR